MGVPPNHPNFSGIFSINQPFWVPPFMETPISLCLPVISHFLESSFHSRTVSGIHTLLLADAQQHLGGSVDEAWTVDGTKMVGDHGILTILTIGFHGIS